MAVVGNEIEQSSILDELDREGYVVIPIRGISMRPLLREASSHVLIRKLQGRPRKNDVVLYVRPDGMQVLHRIRGFEGDVCLIRGDNTFVMERVPLSTVKGVMETVWRGEREIRTSDFLYRLYVCFWNLIYPFRLVKHKMQDGIRRAGKRLLGDTSLAWVVKMAQSSLMGIVLLTLCTGASAVLSVVSALVMREAIDAAVSGDGQMLVRWAAVFLSVIVGNLVLGAVIRQEDERIRASMESHIKEHTYDAILHSSYSSLKVFHTGELQNRMTNDVRVVADYATDLVPDVVSMAVQLLCAMVVLMVLDWRFASIFLVGGMVMLCVTFLFRRRMKELHKEVQEADGRSRSWLQESVESLLIVKSFEAEEMAEGRTKKLAGKHVKARMHRRTFSNICNVGFGAVMQGSYLFGLIWCCVGVLQGTLTYGTLTAVLQLINQIRSPFANMSGFVPQYYAMLASAERLIELEKLPKDSVGEKESLPDFQGIHARHLSFIYEDGEEEVISDASFDIEKGEIVALTGASGIGKSTLLKILLGIYSPVSGELYTECADPEEDQETEDPKAEDLKTEDPKADSKTSRTADRKVDRKIDLDAGTRHWFSYVPQGNMLMSGSIYETVDFLHSAPFTKEQKSRVKQACRIACADEFIRELPEGYDTVLGEKGAGLSEGQMQRIAIAWAIFRDAPVLLLDEATSALDEDTEHRLLHNLEKLGTQTVLIVTHRPATMKICNKRLVFAQAHISVEKVEREENPGVEGC